MKDLRICHVVFCSRVGKTGDNLSRMEAWVQKAVEEKAEMVVFPELSVTGYTTGKKIRAAAVPVPGPETDALVSMAAKRGLVVLAGMAEKDKDGRIFATHVAASPNGLLGSYRKLYISPPEKELFCAGEAPVILKINGVNVGVQLCYDAHFPELSAWMAFNGADLIVIPHASPRGTGGQKLASWMRHLTARAFDNGLFITAVNPVGSNGANLSFPGAGLALDPAGQVLKQVQSQKETLFTIDLKAKDLKRVRGHRMRYFLPNTRTHIWKEAGASVRRFLKNGSGKKPE